ncbi:hypothetical protein RVX72_002883 [Citrobacter freundii]|uniref:hypothetical protein n=1 Tax=Citrobacter freundii TaxID=546 RepID=UPI001F2AFB49|nr:hypothetical protein [Citrobacter freundii]ELK7392491.1 hypothetical protein [Citrobacter freundii]DAY60213.1 MAG TPA: hypothetical protein [Caudoviricetes sp.]
MDLLEASAQLERIELLAKIAHVYESNQREKTIALAWIGELVGEVQKMVRQEEQTTPIRDVVCKNHFQ